MDVLKLIRRFSIFGTGALSAGYLYNNYAEPEKMREAMRLRIENQTVDLPEALETLVNEVLSDLKPPEKQKYNFFITKGIDLTHFGLHEFREGAYIGIPHYYVFDKANDIDPNAALDEDVLADSTAISSLKQSMCLSKEAKKFGLAQEIFKSQHTLVLPYGVMPILFILNFAFLSYCMEKISKRQKQPIVLSSHVLLLLFSICLYGVFQDAVSVYKEIESDFKASELGSSYIQGGLEFYEKMITRNKTLRKVQKNAPFTEDGDINTSNIRKNHMSLPKRLVYLKEFEDKNKEINLFRYIL